MPHDHDNHTIGYRLSDRELSELSFAESPVPQALVDAKGRFVRANAAYSEMLGYALSELERRDFQSITHPEDVVDDLAMLSRCLAGEIPGYEMIKRYITKFGSVVWVKMMVHKIRDSSGQTVMFYSTTMPLANGARTKAENSAHGLTVRPSLTWREMLKDNWAAAIKLTAGALGVILVTYGQWQKMMDRVEKHDKLFEKILQSPMLDPQAFPQPPRPPQDIRELK